MKIHLVSHASVIVETGDVCLWSDPWLYGKAFNDSWILSPPAAWDETWLDKIDCLWVSHEHPDHFHTPTLKLLPERFKNRVTVLFQKNNSDKMPRAFAELGFHHLKLLAHRDTVALTAQTSVYCYHESQINSCLAVLSAGRSALNLNDAEIGGPDCRLIKRDIGPVNVVLNQFSIGGYDGLPDPEVRLTEMAQQILVNLSHNHRDLGAKATIPFASFIYFCAPDNSYINQYANRTADVFNYLAKRNQEAVILYPGDVYEVGRPHDSASALARFERYERGCPHFECDQPQTVPFAEIEQAFTQLSMHLRARYPSAIFYLLCPFTVRIPDLGVTARFALRDSSVVKLDDSRAAQLEINSQPLHFALRYPYGVQTLGVSARVKLMSGIRNWQMHRVLFAMNNAEFYLKPRYLFSRGSREYIACRLIRGGAGSLVRRWRSMMT